VYDLYRWCVDGDAKVESGFLSRLAWYFFEVNSHAVVFFMQSWQRRLDPDLNIMDTLHALLFKADWATSVGHTIDALMAP
jgi:hypothetical protein